MVTHGCIGYFGTVLGKPCITADIGGAGFDKEHVEIIELYAGGMGYNELAVKLGRSTRTPYAHVHRHNDAVNRSGFCALCRRAGGPYANQFVKRRKKGAPAE